MRRWFLVLTTLECMAGLAAQSILANENSIVLQVGGAALTISSTSAQPCGNASIAGNPATVAYLFDVYSATNTTLAQCNARIDSQNLQVF